MKIKFQTPKKRRKNNQPARSEKISTPTNQPITENKPAPKENKPEVTENKPAPPVTNQPMQFSQPVEIGDFGYGERFTGTLIKGASYVNAQPKYVNNHGLVYPKGIARFGDGNDALYLHHGNDNFKIGGKDLKNTILYDYGYGATILKVSATNGYTMYFLKKVYYIPVHQEREFYILIGQRPDGKWVKYFDTENLCKQYMGKSENVSIQKITSNGDTIIVNYARCNRLPKEMMGYFYEKLADEFGEFRFKWDAATQWFSVEKITY